MKIAIIALSSLFISASAVAQDTPESVVTDFTNSVISNEAINFTKGFADESQQFLSDSEELRIDKEIAELERITNSMSLGDDGSSFAWGKWDADVKDPIIVIEKAASSFSISIEEDDIENNNAAE